MSRKHKNNQFNIGKNIPKNDSPLKPMQGYPHSNLDTYNKKDGTFRSRRKFGSTGYAIKDLDVAHNSHNKQDHVHDISFNFRSESRLPNKKEETEIMKAKKKRKFWK